MSVKRNKGLELLFCTAILSAVPIVTMPAWASGERASHLRDNSRLLYRAQFQPPRAREVADHDRARASTQSGQNRSFAELLKIASARGRGEYLGVEPDIRTNIYRFKFMRPGGNMVWVDVDGRTARVIAERE